MLRRALLCVVLPVVLGHAGCALLQGNSRTPAETSDLVAKCTSEARAAYYVGHASVEEAGLVYDACIADGGVDAR